VVPAAGGDPQNGSAIPRPADEGAPDLAAFPGAAGSTSESKPGQNGADSTASPASSGGEQPAQPQGDPSGSVVREVSPNGSGNGGAADDARGPDPAVAG